MNNFQVRDMQGVVDGAHRFETMLKNMTIYDVAALAEVSTSTVSRAISGHPSIKEETRQRILEIVLKTGYRPNPAARNLALNR